MKKVILLLVTILFILSLNELNAEDNYGTNAATFLKLGIGARPAALGNATLTIDILLSQMAL